MSNNFDNSFFLDSTTGDASTGANLKEKTPRELLKKMPRRRSSMSLKGTDDDEDSNPDSRGVTPSPTLGLNKPPPDNNNTKSDQQNGQKHSVVALPPEQQQQQGASLTEFISRNHSLLAKPTPTRTVHNERSFPKPTDPAMETMARKQLLQASRRRSSSGSVQSMVDNSTPLQHAGRAFSPVGTVDPGFRYIPVGGFRDGVFIFTGNVMVSNPNLACAHYWKLNDPTGPLDGPGHLMDHKELQTEMACYPGTQLDQQWLIHELPLMDLVSGRSLSGRHAGLGVAYLVGQETAFINQDTSYNVLFPYLQTKTTQQHVVGPSAQGVRAGDIVAIIVCGQKEEEVESSGGVGVVVYRKKLNLKVVSVPAFGLIVATGASSPVEETMWQDQLVSFPITCVLGVSYGKNWKINVSSRQAAQAKAKQMFGKQLYHQGRPKMN